MPPDIAPMLADCGIPNSLEGWAAEPKLDGWRARVLADDGKVRLRTRSGRHLLLGAVHRPARRPAGRSRRGARRRGGPDGGLLPGRAALARRWQVSFVAFDVLWLDGELLTGRPQLERRRILDELGLPVPVIPSFAYDEAPLLFEACGHLGVEGIVLKQLNAPYRPGQRTPAWRQVKVQDWRPHFERRFIR